MFYLTSSSSERNLSSEKRVSSVWSKLPLNVRELFVELFFPNVFFSIQYGIWAMIYPALSKFSTKLSKTHFTCPREHFYKNILLTLWNNFRLWARKCRICGGTFAALLIKLLFCLQMGISKNSFEGNFTFSDFFGRPGNIFWYFPCIIRGMVVQTEFHKPRWTYPIRKILWENFLSFPDYERIISNSHWSLLGMLSKLVYFFRGALWERLSFFWEFFKRLFGLWAIIVQTSGEMFQQRCQNFIPRVQRTSRFSLQ